MSRRLLIWCGLLYAGYVWWVWPRIGLPLLADEVAFAASAQRTPTEMIAVIPHPLTYLGMLRSLLWWGMPAGPWLRVVGVASFGITLVLVAYVAHRLTPGSGALAAALWAMHPMAIQGSLILEIDTALLTMVMTAYLALLMTFPIQLSKPQVGWLGAALAGCLWVKLSCAPFLLLALAVRAWSLRNWQLGWRHLLQVAGIGGSLFLASWTLVSQAAEIPWMSIFQWVFSAVHRGLQGPVFSVATEFLNRIIRIGLWLNPWLILLLIPLGRWVWQMDRTERWRWWCAASLVGSLGVGYLVVRGTHFGFTKYHLPALPAALALLAAMTLRLGRLPKAQSVLVLGAAVLVGACYFWWVGDLLYDVNFTLRTALITGVPAVQGVVRMLWVRGLFYALPGVLVCAAVWRSSRSRRWQVGIAGLLVLLLSSNLALDLRQRQAAYATTYTYGRPWASFHEAVHFVAAYRQAHPQQDVVGPVDVLWAAGVLYSKWLSLSLPDGGATVRQAVANPAVGCIMYGTTTHDLKAWRGIFDTPDFLQPLERQFTRSTLGQGEYVVWVRRS